MPKQPQPSGLQIMCQYQIPALLSGGNPALVLSDEFVAGVRAGYAQTSAKCNDDRDAREDIHLCIHDCWDNT